MILSPVVAPGGVAEWLCSGLQSRPRRFDSDLRLQDCGLIMAFCRFLFDQIPPFASATRFAD